LGVTCHLEFFALSRNVGSWGDSDLWIGGTNGFALPI
jgi:hypothetical protein